MIFDMINFLVFYRYFFAVWAFQANGWKLPCHCCCRFNPFYIFTQMIWGSCRLCECFMCNKDKILRDYARIRLLSFVIQTLLMIATLFGLTVWHS